MRFERKYLGALAAWLVVYMIWVYGLSPPRFDPAVGEMILGLQLFDSRYDPWLIWVHNIYGLYGIPYAAMMLVDDRDQSFPAWPLAVLAIMVLGTWPILFYYAIRQPRGLFSSPHGGVVRFFESPIPGLYTLGFSIWLTYRAISFGSLEVLQQSFMENFYIHGSMLDLVILWLVFPIAQRVDMQRRGITNKAWYALGLVWMVGPVLYLWLRPPLPKPR